MPCRLSCTSRSVLAKPLEPQCSRATISPGCGANSLRISPPTSRVRRSCATSGLLDWRNVRPGLVVAWAVSVMQRIEDAKTRLPRRVEHLRHMQHTAIGFGNGLQATPELAALGDKIVIRIDHQKGGDLPVVCHRSRAAVFDMQSLLDRSPRGGLPNEGSVCDASAILPAA